MLRFQEDTARHLFRMQIIGPDGTPIEIRRAARSCPGHVAAAQAQQELRRSRTSSTDGPARTGRATWPTQQRERQYPAARQPVPISRPAPSTTIDALEREFQKKKQRELEQARAVGSATAASNGNAPRVTGEKVGRNDPCPCGSGKKFKKCHGAEA